MFSMFASKDAFLILRMFAKCLSVNLFLSAVLIFFMLEKNCSQEYVLPHIHNNLAVAISPSTANYPWNIFCRDHSRVFI